MSGIATTKSSPAKAAQPSTKKAETRKERFVRIANLRVPKALKAIHMIGNLAGAGYEFTPEQVAKINSLLAESVAKTMQQFSNVKTQAPTQASLF